MELACPACGSMLEADEAKVTSPRTQIACPSCRHVFAAGQAQRKPITSAPPKRVPPPVSPELTKTRRMSTGDMPFRVAVETDSSGKQVAVVFCTNHPQTRGQFQCESCVRVYCDRCRKPGDGVATCPLCDKPMWSLSQPA